MSARRVIQIGALIAVAVGLLLIVPRLETDRSLDRFQKIGGTFQISDAGDVHWARLPPGAGEAELMLHAGIPQLRHLNLAGTDVTDKCLAALADFPELRLLDLSKTQHVRQGFSHIRDLESLV